MVAFFILAIATLGIVSYIAVFGAQAVSTTSDAQARVETARRLDQVVAGLQARMGAPQPDGVMYMPVGADNGPGLGWGLPAALRALGQTPFGKPFVYCPFGPVGPGLTGPIVNANSSSYNVDLVAVDGESWVIGGRPAYAQLAEQPNIVAYVLAPRSRTSPMPSCNQVTFNTTTKRFEVPDGLVRVVTRDGTTDAARSSSSRKLTFHVTPHGTGTGASVADPTSLDAAFTYFRSKMPRDMVISMGSGTYSASAETMAKLRFNDADNANASLTLEHAGGGINQVLIDSPGSSTIQIPGTFTLNGVNFNSSVFILAWYGRKVMMRNSSTGVLYAQGGEATLQGQNSLTSNVSYLLGATSGGSVFLQGKLFVNSNAVGGLIVSHGSTLKAQAAEIIFQNVTSYAVRIQQGGTAVFEASSLTLAPGTNYTFHNQGDLLLQSTTTSSAGATNMSVASFQGSRFRAEASRLGLGTPPTMGIYDYGAASFEGASSRFYATSNCWYGGMFFESYAPSGVAAGIRSAIQPDVALPALSASPTGAEVRAYADAQATNSRRRLGRTSNSSDWICNS